MKLYTPEKIEQMSPTKRKKNLTFVGAVILLDLIHEFCSLVPFFFVKKKRFELDFNLLIKILQVSYALPIQHQTVLLLVFYVS